MAESRLKHPVPPWVGDPEPCKWVPLWVAADLYFRRAYQVIWRMTRDSEGGQLTTLEEFGFPLYHDGRRVWVRLPIPIDPSQYPERSERRIQKQARGLR